MIRHIVLFKIKPEYQQEIPQLVKNFYTMKGHVEGLLDLEPLDDDGRVKTAGVREDYLILLSHF